MCIGESVDLLNIHYDCVELQSIRESYLHLTITITYKWTQFWEECELILKGLLRCLFVHSIIPNPISNLAFQKPNSKFRSKPVNKNKCINKYNEIIYRSCVYMFACCSNVTPFFVIVIARQFDHTFNITRLIVVPVLKESNITNEYIFNSILFSCTVRNLHETFWNLMKSLRKIYNGKNRRVDHELTFNFDINIISPQFCIFKIC